MEWLESLRAVLNYLEEHLLEDITPEDAAAQVHMSPVYLQQGFRIVTGYSISEYLRSRRLFLAALELRDTDCRVIDAALKYGYETPESFTKAFTRFHGVTPAALRRGGPVTPFLPLRINLTVKGGFNVDFSVTTKPAFRLIGLMREFSFPSSYEEIPRFWNELHQSYAKPLHRGKAPETPMEHAFLTYRIGEFGLCADDMDIPGRFHYLIGGRYNGGDVPEGMTVYAIPETAWAVFPCSGPLPNALQSVNRQIFGEWLPGNPDYELDGRFNIEWYSPSGSIHDSDYQTAIWIPVKKK